MIVIGLGNPGPKYQPTRHNVGFWLIDTIAQRHGVRLKKPFFKPWLTAVYNLSDHRVTLIKPLTFMNRSGDALADNPDWQPGPDRRIVVCCDQMDLPPGSMKLKNRGGSAGHNGLKSLSAVIGETYSPLYIGIGRPLPGIDVVNHVLGEPSSEDRSLIMAGLQRAAEGIDFLAIQGIDATMNLLNRRDGPNHPT